MTDAQLNLVVIVALLLLGGALRIAFLYGARRDPEFRKSAAIFSFASRYGSAVERPLKLAGVALGVVLAALLLDRVTQSHLAQRFLFPAAGKGPEWKDLFQALLVILGLPIGLMLWHWRDLSVRQQIDNSRKDTTLKEFSELMLRGAGAVDEALPLSGRIATQVAALHLLRPYLRGELGESYKLAAFELYCAVLEAQTMNAKEPGSPAGDDDLSATSDVAQVPLRVFTTVRVIVRDEWEAFFCSGFNLAGRSFRNIVIPPGARLERLNFDNTDLAGADFSRVEFSDCDFAALLDDAQLENATFSDCRFPWTEMPNVRADGATFRGCIFTNVHAQDGSFNGSTFELGGSLDTDFSGADFTNAIMDEHYFRGCGLAMTRLGGLLIRRSVFQNSDFYQRDLTRVAIDKDTAFLPAVDDMQPMDIGLARQIWDSWSAKAREDARRSYKQDGASFHKSEAIDRLVSFR